MLVMVLAVSAEHLSSFVADPSGFLLPQTCSGSVGRDRMFYSGANCPGVNEPGHGTQGRRAPEGNMLVYLALAC